MFKSMSNISVIITIYQVRILGVVDVLALWVCNGYPQQLKQSLPHHLRVQLGECHTDISKPAQKADPSEPGVSRRQANDTPREAGMEKLFIQLVGPRMVAYWNLVVTFTMLGGFVGLLCFATGSN